MKPLAAFVIAAACLGSPWLPQSKAVCGACRHPSAGQCCREEKVTYMEQRTRYKLVKQQVPVCKVKYERRQDPCDPCKKTRVPVTYWENKTRYRFARVCEPVCRTKTVRVCDGTAPEGVGMIRGAPIAPREGFVAEPAAAPAEQPATPKYENERMAIY